MQTSNNYLEENGSEICVKRFNEMLNEDSVCFFDVFEFELIIRHFVEEFKLTKALKACEYALSQHPYATSVKIEKAQILLQLGELEESLDLLKVLAELEPANPEIMLMMGSCLSFMEKHEEALKYFSLAEKYSYEDRDDVLYNIGLIFIQSEEYKNAISYLEKAYAENAENESVMYELAYCYDKIGEHEKSACFYNKCLDIDPFSEFVWYNLGIVQNKLGNIDKAIEAYDFALAIDETYSSAHFNKANTLANSGKYRDAIQSYQEYLKYDKESEDTLCYIAECYFQLREHKTAFEYYRKVLNKNSGNAVAWYGSALVLLIEDKIEECYLLLKKAIKIDDNRADFWNTFGKVNSILNNYEEAEQAFQKALELDKNNSDFWVSFSGFYYEYEQIGMAIDTLKKAVDLKVHNASLYYRLAGYMMENDEEKHAIGYLERALSEDFDSHSEFFEHFPKARNFNSVDQLISKYNVSRFYR